MAEKRENVIMAPALPVDPDTAEAITKPTKIVEEMEKVPANNADTEILSLELDADEKHLFASLRKAVDALQQGKLKSALANKSVQVRVAGGWVRDKILGLQTHDVDIALDTCTGVEFATLLKEYIHEFEHEKTGKIGVIAANPAQSKHLETATMRLYGIDVDFCNLRHETYAEDSRIPTSMIGTPLEDSYRRDFTINALYYNLQTFEVEDWTRLGLRDLLETRRVVTPLEAYQTFHDDPLRVLRAIRFAVRYEMRLSDDLQSACMNTQIHSELHRKVSRERVGKELEGMLSGKHANPIQALKLICNLKLAGSVFAFPTEQLEIVGTLGQARLEPIQYRGESEDELAHLRQVAWEESRECIRVLPKLLEILPTPKTGFTKLDSRLLYLAVVLLPFDRLQYVKKHKVKLVAEYMIRDAIKFKNKDVQAMMTILKHLDSMLELLQQTPDAMPATRLQAGLLLRATQELWVTTLIAATVVLLRKQKASPCNMDWYKRASQWYHSIVDDLELEECWKIKPLLNGKEVMHHLGLAKGPQVGVYTQEQMQWMLMNPKGTLKECQAFLKSFKKRREFQEDEAAQHVAKKMHL